MACYCQSQLCNWLQKDVAACLYSDGLSDRGLMLLHSMGMSVSQQQLHTFIKDAKRAHVDKISATIKQALEKGQRLSLMVDDYTNIHAIRRPTSERTVDVTHMATVLIRIFDRPAIPARGDNIGPVNDPAGVDIDSLVAEFQAKMTTVLQPFTMTAPPEILAQFFTPQNERNRLTTHMYGENNNLRRTRGLANTHLVDCVEQPLKSVANFRQAGDVFLNTPLADYLEKYAVLTPGDWPAQFYHRQIAYNNIFQPECLRNISPSIGPLHISLNSQEHVVRKHITLFRRLHHFLFAKPLANKPRPWRVTLLLELLYGGWTLIREQVLHRLSRFKDVQFISLLHLLDNNIPLTLSIYSVIFKSNLYESYNHAMMQIWVMFWIYQRRHYDKAPLVWLAQRIYWRHINHPMLAAVSNHLEEEDEYPIEHFHGQIRGETNEYDSAERIRTKALWIDNTKDNLHNLRSWFLPPIRATFSNNQLRALKVKAARFLVGLVNEICTHPFAGHELPRQPRQRKNVSRWILPDLYGQEVVRNPLLPLGYQFVGHRQLVGDLGPNQPLQPSQHTACDHAGCNAPPGSSVLLFRCGHSFHASCLTAHEREQRYCFICSMGLRHEIRRKAQTAREAMLNPNANPEQGNASDSDDEEGGVHDLGAHNAPDLTPQQAQAQVAQLALQIATLPAVPLV